jgi:hypothetical protein
MFWAVLQCLRYNNIMLSHEDKVRLAQTADHEELWKLVRDPSSDVVVNSIFNKGLTEDMAAFIAKKKNTSSEILGMLAADVRFKGSYKLKLSICRNPKTPPKITLSLLKFLRIFDLGDITKDQNIPINIRQKIEYSLIERSASLPSGVKVALSKRSSINVIVSLLEKGDKNVICSCLESPSLTEEHLCKLINAPAARPLLIKALSGHSRWSLRYRIRYSLVRNYHTPMSDATKFIDSLKTADLRELYSDKFLPSSTRPYIFSELCIRNESVEIPREKRYNLSGDEDSDLAATDI